MKNQDNKLIAANFRDQYERRAASVMRHYAGNPNMRERVNSAFLSLAVTHSQVFSGEFSIGELTPILISVAKRGVLLDGKEAVIIPRFNKRKGCKELTLVVQAEGVRRIINNDKNISEFHCVVIKEGDLVEYDPMSNVMPTIKLRANPFVMADTIGVIAAAKTASGQVIVEMIGVEEIKKNWSRPDYTQGGKWDDEWYRNIAVKRLYKRLPLSFVNEGGAATQWDDGDIAATGDLVEPAEVVEENTSDGDYGIGDSGSNNPEHIDVNDE